MSSLSDLLEPIPGPNPSGEATRYTGFYDRIKEARREEPDLPQGVWQHERKTADWRRVAHLCEDALIHKIKDIQVASWLTEALLHRDGVPGLTEGLKLLQGLLDQFWPTVFPRAEEDELEFRAGPLEWVGWRLDVASSILQTPGIGSRHYRDFMDELDSSQAALGQLQASCEAHFGDVSPRFDGLRKSLETLRLTLRPLTRETTKELDFEDGPSTSGA